MIKRVLKVLLKWLLTSLEDGKITKEEAKELLREVNKEIKKGE